MVFDYAGLMKTLNERFGDSILSCTEFRSQHVVRIKRESNLAILKFLRDDPAARFEMLTDVTCVDGLRAHEGMTEFVERFAVVYQLTSISNNARLRIKAYVPEDPCEIESASGLWASANWGEREAFDFFGVIFKNHPDLRRILMPEGYEGHPLRKDYPLKGRGERDNFVKFVKA